MRTSRPSWSLIWVSSLLVSSCGYQINARQGLYLTSSVQIDNYTPYPKVREIVRQRLNKRLIRACLDEDANLTLAIEPIQEWSSDQGRGVQAAVLVLTLSTSTDTWTIREASLSAQEVFGSAEREFERNLDVTLNRLQALCRSSLK